MQGDSLLMLPLIALVLMVGLPLLATAVVMLRIRAKERGRDSRLEALAADLRQRGAEPLGDGHYRLKGRVVKVECSTNPLFSSAFTWRLSAYSNTVHEFELKRGKPVAPEFEAFMPLLERWDSAGKMFVECYAAGPSLHLDDLQKLQELAALPLSKSCRGGTFTIREGFERDVPQWHWRHDQRRSLIQGTQRWCVSYWKGDPYLNPGLLRLFEELAAGNRMFYLSDAEDLSFLEHAFDRRDFGCWGALVEVKSPVVALAADLHLDGAFMGGLFAADDLPPGFDGKIPRYRFHDEALRAVRWVRFYVRRLMDGEASWYGGEYEILSLQPLDVRGAVAKVAAEFGAQVMELDRRFHKRIVVPLDY